MASVYLLLRPQAEFGQHNYIYLHAQIKQQVTLSSFCHNYLEISCFLLFLLGCDREQV